MPLARIRQGAAQGGCLPRGGTGQPGGSPPRLAEDFELVIGEDTEDEQEGAA